MIWQKSTPTPPGTPGQASWNRAGCISFIAAFPGSFSPRPWHFTERPDAPPLLRPLARESHFRSRPRSDDSRFRPLARRHPGNRSSAAHRPLLPPRLRPLSLESHGVRESESALSSTPPRGGTAARQRGARGGACRIDSRPTSAFEARVGVDGRSLLACLPTREFSPVARPFAPSLVTITPVTTSDIR